MCATEILLFRFSFYLLSLFFSGLPPACHTVRHHETYIRPQTVQFRGVYFCSPLSHSLSHLFSIAPDSERTYVWAYQTRIVGSFSFSLPFSLIPPVVVIFPTTHFAAFQLVFTVFFNGVELVVRCAFGGGKTSHEHSTLLSFLLIEQAGCCTGWSFPRACGIFCCVVVCVVAAMRIFVFLDPYFLFLTDCSRI